MKKLVLTFFACLMMVGLFAQKESIQNLVEGNISEDVFVEQMMDYFGKYNLNSAQTAKVKTLVVNKAENYSIIAKMRDNDPKLFKSKMSGQRQHLIESLRYILDQEQYRNFMIDVRTQFADKNQTKKK